MTVRTPIESRTRSIPVWALAFTVVVLVIGGVYAGGNLSGENPPIIGEPSVDTSGQAIAIMTQAQCYVCHGPDLMGNIGPSLHGVVNGPVSENLQALGASNPDDWAHLWIAGTDPAVAGLDRGGMPVFADPPTSLTDDQITIVVDYLKSLQ
jgi:mono/diheme cytochrome c family protein